MTPTRKTRLIYVLTLVVGLSIATAFIFFAFVANMKSFRVPTEVNAGDFPEGKEFKVGGFVVDGSLDYQPGSTTIGFVITDKGADTPEGEELTVQYTGLLPSLFREGQWTVAEGEYVDGVFKADRVMAKHDENYVSPSATDEKLQARIDRAKALRDAMYASEANKNQNQN